MRYTEDCARRPELSIELRPKEHPHDKGDYIQDVKCLNTEVLELIQKILATDTSDPIIIVQADHGVRFVDLGLDSGDDPNIPSGEVLRTSFAILNAMKLPAACRDMFYDRISPVNTFRLVFSCLEGKNFDPIPDRQFLYDGTQYIEIFFD